MDKEFTDAAANTEEDYSYPGEPYLERGESLWAKGQFRLAIKSLRYGLGRSPESPELLLSLGQKFAKLYDKQNTYCTQGNTFDILEKAMRVTTADAYKGTQLRADIVGEYAQFHVRMRGERQDTRRTVEVQILAHLKESPPTTPVLCALADIYRWDKKIGLAFACLDACRALPDCTDAAKDMQERLKATFEPQDIKSHWATIRTNIERAPVPASL